MTTHVSRYKPSDWPAVAPVWESLTRETGKSVFLSPAWIETWLETYCDAVDPSILVFREEDQAIGACLIARTPSRLTRPVTRLCLNASGEDVADTTYTEFNDLVCLPGKELNVAQALRSSLADEEWDQLMLDGFREGAGYDALRQACGDLALEETWHSTFLVDLQKVRASGRTYRDTLPSGLRKHLRQGLRYYSELGPVRFEVATGPDMALNFLAELSELSRVRQISLGKRSVFSSDRFQAFHRSYIRKTFAGGGVQLVRATAGGTTIGLLYNLIHEGRVYFYQCGYRYSADRRLSPGTVSLALAIQHCLESGFQEFHFLSGGAFYKERMSNDRRRLVWAAFSRPSMRLSLLSLVKHARQGLRQSAQSA